MASHHKSPTPGTRVTGVRTPALATAALTSVAFLPQTADAALPDGGPPSREEVERKVGDLYRQAVSAAGKHNGVREKTPKQRKPADPPLTDAATSTRTPNEAREEPASSAPARDRTGPPDTATFPLPDPPQSSSERNPPLGRAPGRPAEAVDDHVTQDSRTLEKHREATTGSIETPAGAHDALKNAKAAVQKKLGTARELMSKLNAEETARLAVIEEEKREEAARRTAELTRQQAERQKAGQDTRQQEATTNGAPHASGSSGSTTTTPAASTDSSYTAKAEKVLAFARAQIGKPYVWGATGPGSYDCSGLTQGAWRAAGVSLPRSARDQVRAGTTVPASQALPGDLVFFYDDITHVGVYIGNSMMIHAPKPGTYVREESVFHDGGSSIHSVVRPA